MAKNSSNQNLIGIDVYLERRKSREYVGRLTKTKSEGKFTFEFSYEQRYILKSNAIPLGPEFPLTQEKFSSRRLFPSFEDRIPSKKNPAYPEYCRLFGLSPEENDPFLLLSTIGRRGPSSFVFEPVSNAINTKINIGGFRKELGLTLREFAAAFDTSPATLQKLELGRAGGNEVLKRLQIYIKFPDVALWELKKNRAQIHDNKYQQALKRLESKL